MGVQFSTEQLRLLEKKLTQKKETIQKQIKELKGSDPFSDPDHVVDNAAVDTDVREEVGHEEVMAKIKVLENNLKEVIHALRKIKNGKYGLCERCGSPIKYARLQLIPEARYCLDCERKMKA